MTAAASTLHDVARDAMSRAYAPYSGFRVGAALATADGTVFPGCNVENSSFPAGTCAERVALGSAVAAGHRNFARIVIATEAEVPTPPCGICRQALTEFAPSLDIVSITTAGAEAHWSLSDLLPHPFTPQSLHHL